MFRKPVIIAAAVATAACFGMPFLGGTASAASGFQISSDSSPFYCMQENGISSGLFLDPCGSNSSDFWEPFSSDSFEYENAHSHLCITYEGTNAAADLHPCVPHAIDQDWFTFPANGLNAPDEICLVNDMSSCLWQSNKTVQDRESSNPTNVHDLWNE